MKVLCNNSVTGKKEEVEVTEKIGHLKNNWRRREVGIWEHPTNPDWVVTIGKGFDGGSDAFCIEKKEEWKGNIGNFRGIFN